MKATSQALILLNFLIASLPLHALEPEEIWNTCRSMFGNNIAVKKYISSLKGQILHVNGRVNGIEEGFLWSDPVVSIDTDYSNSWLLTQYVQVSMPESQAIKMRIDDSWEMTVVIDDIRFSTDSQAYAIENNCWWIEATLQ